METSIIHIGEQRKAFAPTYRDVVIRAKNGNYITVSLGFDTKGNDITCLINKDDILPKQYLILCHHLKCYPFIEEVESTKELATMMRNRWKRPSDTN